MDRWQKMHAQILSLLPYPVTITPGTHFGPNELQISGPASDFYPHYHFILSANILAQLESAGIHGLFPAPVLVESKRVLPSEYFELQIEHTASLAGELDHSKRIQSMRDVGIEVSEKDYRCTVCGRNEGELPKPLILKGSTIPDGIHLFRLAEKPFHIFCTEPFARAVKKLKGTNILFEPVKADGSEKKSGYAKISPSLPSAWLKERGAAPAPKTPRRSPNAKPLRSPRRQPQLASLIATHGLTGWAHSISSVAQPTIRFAVTEVHTWPCGKSRCGGTPDLPKNLAWPGSAKAPLDFLLQLNLSEIAQYIPPDTLPKKGFLWFFYDTDKTPWLVTPKDKNPGAVVLHSDCSVAELGPTTAPAWISKDALLPLCAMKFARGQSLPLLDRPESAVLKLKEAERKSYQNLVRAFDLDGEKEVTIHKLLGYPNEVQNDMTAELGAALKIPKARRADWRLLLQLDSDSNASLQWFDNGRLYFWISKQNLAAKKFDQCSLILQSH